MPKLNIFIVEDEPCIARVLKQTVQYIGHHVCGMATSFDGAVKGLQHAGADLIITDIMLEGEKTGVDLAKYINKYLKIPIVFQSSVIDQLVIDEALKTDPLVFMPKPLSSRILIDAIAAGV